MTPWSHFKSQKLVKSCNYVTPCCGGVKPFIFCNLYLKCSFKVNWNTFRCSGLDISHGLYRESKVTVKSENPFIYFQGIFVQKGTLGKFKNNTRLPESFFEKKKTSTEGVAATLHFHSRALWFWYQKISMSLFFPMITKH